MTTNPTTTLNLSRPNFNDSGWHEDMNQNAQKIDTALAALNITDVDSVWAVSTAYVAGDRVRDPDDGTIWDAQTNHTSGTGSFAADRGANPSYWAQVTTGVVWRSGWVTATAYRLQDLVRQNGNVYICLEGHTSGTFSTDLAAGKWELFVEKGAAGAGTGDVIGPASANDGTIPLFDGTSGTLLKDSGLTLADYAELDSPTFIGTPAGPTQSPGNNSTALATTAFVTAAVSAATSAILGGVSASFDTLSELAAGLNGKLAISSNLSDIGNVATAFNNIKQAASLTATGVVELATAAEWRTGTDATRVLQVKEVWDAQAFVTLTDAATVTTSGDAGIDFSKFINAQVTLGGNRTLGAPTNVKVGQSGVIKVIQDGSGGRTLAYHADFLWEGNDPVLSTTLNYVDYITYFGISTTQVICGFMRRPA